MSRQRVVNILRGPEASRIRFTFPTDSGTITIAQYVFLRVARAIEGRKVGVTVRNDYAPGIGSYRQPNNLWVPPVIGRLDEGAVLHECIHAYFDLAKTEITALDEEAAGFVVDALYFRMTGLPRSRWDNNLSELAGFVASGLLAEYAAGKTPIPPVGRISWNLLRAAILFDPDYAETVGDGGSFPHDG
jgi:hypothetical protein